jgi:hypothetical protein
MPKAVGFGPEWSEKNMRVPAPCEIRISGRARISKRDAKGVRMKIDLKFSRKLALATGPVLPILETIRRIRIGGDFVWWLDDYLIGLFLIGGALLARRNPDHGRIYLASAWGFTLGMGYVSFFSHLQRNNEIGAAQSYNGPVIGVVGVGMILATLGLIGSLRFQPSDKRDN